ncbi:Uncharacterised protein [Mycobacterium tuberculosis]|nr:Uncharacterised protein [Mycobacterium tuberculosis]SGM31180.1 Uncharacterised protein [Mycobacterium tuberculosis]
MVPEAHPVPRPGPHRAQRRRRAGDAGVRVQVRRIFRGYRRCSGPDGRPAADQPDLESGALQAITGVGGLAARLLHDVDRGSGTDLAAVGVLLLASHHSRPGLGRRDHGPGFRPATRLPIPGEAVYRRLRASQPVAAATGRSGAHRDRRHGDRLLYGAHSRGDERHHRVEVPYFAECNHVDWPHRHGDSAAVRLLHHISVVYRIAAQRSVGARARRRDRHHQAAAPWRLHRAASAPRPGRRAWPPDTASVSGSAAAQANEQAGLGRIAG